MPSTVKPPKAPVVHAFLEDDGSFLHVAEKHPDGVRWRRIRASYTTYHKAEDLTPRLLRALRDSDHVAHIENEGDAWVRIGWKNDYLRRQARWKFQDIGVECFEGDVDPVMFWLVHQDAKIAKPRRCYLDLETDSRVPLSRKQDMRILTYTVTGHDLVDGKVESKLGILEEDDDDAEADLLTKLTEHLKGFDQICVWEGDWKGGEFDSFVYPVRCRRAGVDVDARRWIWLNQLAVWKKMNQHAAESGAEKESYKLDDVCFEQLGVGKELTPDWVVKRFGDKTQKGLGALAWDLWEAGGKFRELLGRYNVRDAELLRRLELKKGYITLFQATCEICGIPPVTKSLEVNKQMDGYLLRLGRQKNVRFPTKKFRENDEEETKKFRGAVVFHPKSVASKNDDGEQWTKEQAAAWRKEHGFANGILRNLHVCDFKSLYPSVMISFNLSGDMVVGRMTKKEFEAKGVPPGHCYSPGTGIVTRTDVHGFLPIALRDLIANRKQYADAAAKLPYGTPDWVDMNSKSNAAKVTANSFYGGGGSPGSRYFNIDVSESCTQNGVHFLRLTKDEGEKRKMHLVYGDTDSNMVIGPTIQGFDRFVKWMNEKRIPEEVAKFGVTENIIENAFEKSYARVVFVSAKAYVASLLHYKWSTTCNQCTKPDSEGNPQPGSVDVRKMKCRDCGYEYKELPKNLGEPEIKGVAYKRGDKGKLARELQGRIIDLLVGGLKMKAADGKRYPANKGLRIRKDEDGDPIIAKPEESGTPVEVPCDDLDVYRAVVRAARDHVLTDPLPIEEVRFSNSVNKKLKEYIKKSATGKESVPAHIQAAKVLEARGESVGAGSRIEFVVVDGNATPHRVIPASDYAGECDRFYLWERVYTPSKALLEAAFPDVDWEEWANVRPKSGGKKGKKPLEGQLGLALTASPRVDVADEIAAPAFKVKPLIVEVPEEAGTAAVDRVKEVLEQHPGARAVELHIVLKTGARAVLAVSHRVTTGLKLKEAVVRAISGEAA